MKTTISGTEQANVGSRFEDCRASSANSSEGATRPAKRSKKSSSNDNPNNALSEVSHDLLSSQDEMNE